MVSSEEQLRDALAEQFLVFYGDQPAEPEFLDLAAGLAARLNWTAAKFVEEFIVFSFPKNIMLPSVQSFWDFERSLTDSRPLVDANSSNNEPTFGDNGPLDMAAFYGVRLHGSDLNAATSAVQIRNVLVQFGPNKGDLGERFESRPLHIEAYDVESVLKPYKYMHRDIRAIIGAISARMEYLCSEMADCIGVTLTPIGAETEETVWHGGMLCLLADRSRFDADAFYLQGSCERSNARCVHLDLSKLASYAVFPGQTVLVKGVLSNKIFLVSQIYAGQPPGVSVAPMVGTLIPSFRMFVAAGPFAQTSGSDFGVLDDLIRHCAQARPNVLVLLGPFVSDNGKRVLGEAQEKSHDCRFAKSVLSQLEQLCNMDIRVLVISSPRDLLGQPVYPCPAYTFGTATNWKTSFFKDPSIIKLGPVVVAATSTDIVRHLTSDEVFVGTDLTRRIDRQLRHLLCQQNFYPLYPANLEVPLDKLHQSNGAGLPVKPHIFLVPSSLTCFVKNVDHCVFVNPGRCFKRTFARLHIHGGQSVSDIVNNTQVDVVQF